MANHPSSDPKIQEIVRSAREEQRQRVKAQNSTKPKGNKGKGKSKGKKSSSVWNILFG